MGNLSKMRSGFEITGRAFLDENGIKFGYETTALPYIIPMTKRKYHPDFDIGDTHYEFKGYWQAQDRKKMLLVKEQNPGAKIVIVFQRPKNKIAQLSRTTYTEWATKNGFAWLTYPEWQARMLELKAEGKV